MLIEPDHETGTVRADPMGVALLLRAAHGGLPSGHPETDEALSTGRLGEAMPVVVDPLVTLSLVVAGRDARLEHRAWVSRQHAVLMLGVRPGLVQLQVEDPAFLTAALVRLTRIRPRRTDQRADVGFSTTRLPDLVTADASRRRRALADARADLAWRLETGWAGGSRELTAVDGPNGLHLADPAEPVLRPATNTLAYRILSTVLPDDGELAG